MISLAEAQDRYGTTAAGLKARMAHLGITTIGDSELQALDALNEHLQSGKRMNTFVFTPESPVEIIPAKSSQGVVSSSDRAGQFLHLEQLDRIYSFLQKAADNNWHLPTSVVHSLTGASPKGQYWARYGFMFIPASRHGNEKAWAVRQADWNIQDHQNG